MWLPKSRASRIGMFSFARRCASHRMIFTRDLSHRLTQSGGMSSGSGNRGNQLPHRGKILSLTIKVKNCLQPPNRLPRFEARIADSVLFKDDKGQFAEGVIQAISQDGESVSIVLAHGWKNDSHETKFKKCSKHADLKKSPFQKPHPIGLPWD